MAWDRAGAWNSGIQGLTSDGLKLTASIPILLPNGSAAAPSLAWYNGRDGFYVYSDTLAIGLQGVLAHRFSQTDFLIFHDDASFKMGISQDVRICRDAANILALKNANEQQEFRIYSGNGAYGKIVSISTLLTLSGATTTWTGAIPAGSVPLLIATYVTTLITGATGYTVGDGLDADRWGDSGTGVAVGTTTTNANWTANTIQMFPTANNIVITAKTSAFTAGGLRVVITYIGGIAPTS